MPEIVPFPSRPPQPADRLEQIAGYGTLGPLSAALVRRIGAMAGLVHVVVIGPPAVGVETVATLADDEKGHVVARVTALAILRAINLAETAFTCRSEAC